MKFPFYVCELTKEEKEIFLNHFVEKDNRFYFEGIWFRNQRKENEKASGYIDETTQKRRYIQFYDAYEVETKNEKDYLVVKDSFIYVSNTFKKEEIEKYKQKVLNALQKASFLKLSENHYKKESLEVELMEYNVHPKNKEGNVVFPKNYCSLDITVHTTNYLCKEENDRMWTLSTKMFRQLDKRENPTYIKSVKELKDFLPAQIEMGCGPSIAVGIPPLYEMHETYKVQNHDTGKFYFGEEDDLLVRIIENPQKMYERFSYVPKVIIKSKPTKAYETFAKLYHNGIFCGTVLNNNFDRLVKRFDIPEKILRIYDKGTYLPKVEFSSDAKSLICIGTHADRRQVQRQARAAGKQVIFIDPEGFYNQNGFEPYPIEGPRDGDIILKTTFEEAMSEFEQEFLKGKKMNIVKIKEKLLNYLKRNFNMEDPNILRKYEHTQWVATYCYDIAKELNLNEEQKNLAYVLGLFHDYGRFTQWVRYGTYNDKLSYPHAELGVELLFGNNEIENFSVPKKHYNLLKIVILQHSKLEINKSITNNEQLLFCKIIRDADKVNLYELNIDGTMPTFTNLDGVTKEVLQSVEGCKCVNNIFVKTKLDRALLSLASTYDLNFAFSYKKLEDMQYFEKMATRFEKILNKEDNVILLKAIDVIKTNLQKTKQKNKTKKQNK